jgi:hypothetical protein
MEIVKDHAYLGQINSVGHMVSVTIIQLCCYSMDATIDHRLINHKLYLQKQPQIWDVGCRLLTSDPND